MSVVDLAERRARQHEPGDDATRCPCGSEWFRLEGWPSGSIEQGQVTFATDGRITGWAGRPICAECGKPL